MTEAQIHALAVSCYNGVPLAFVEIWPARGDLVIGRYGALSEGETWTVTGREGGSVFLGRGDLDVQGDFPEGASIRHSSTFDGLFWLEGGSERDGYALFLLTPEAPPGSRRWSVGHRRHREPEVHALEVVSTTEQCGPTYRPRKQP